MSNEAEQRQFELDAARLVGRELVGVQYWDIHNWSDEPRVWDYDDWHHAVMGVELMTDAGPFTITWTNRFFPYGVEVFPDPISQHLTLGPEGPEGWDPTTSARWTLLPDRVRDIQVFWERIEVGPAVRQGDGVEVSPAETYQVPVALRLDLTKQSVWFVAGMPMWPDTEKFFIPGDEILIVWTKERLRALGFPDTSFAVAANQEGAGRAAATETDDLQAKLPLLEAPRAAAPLDDIEAARLVAYGLRSWSDWWASKALDWVDEGVWNEHVVAALVECRENKEFSQNTRHRAQSHAKPHPADPNWGRTTAERMTLISQARWLYFEPPVWVQAGETFWVEDRTLHVEAKDGAVRQFHARASRPDDVR